MAVPVNESVIWVRYEPRKMLVLCTALSAEAELAHRRLADTVWATGQWPPSTGTAAAQLARVVRDRWPSVLSELRAAGWYRRKRHLKHPLVQRVYEEARRYLRTRSSIGIHANRVRWGQDRDPAAIPQGSPCDPKGSPSGIAKGSPVTVQSQYTNKAVNFTEHLMRSVSVQSKAGPGEPEFMRDLTEALLAFNAQSADADLANWGGWWRNRYRENPDKARRILAEMRSMIREGRVLKTPGAAANDLWSRLPP